MDWFSELPFRDFAPRLTRSSDPEPEDLPLDPKWRMRAVCRGRGRSPEEIARWFPGPGGSHAGKTFCRVCPVARECAAEADNLGIEWGIWGGEIRRRNRQDDTTNEDA